MNLTFYINSEECMIRVWKIGKKRKICCELELNYIPLIIRKINNKCISTGSSLGIKLYSFKMIIILILWKK